MLGDQEIRRKKTSLFCLYIGGSTKKKKVLGSKKKAKNYFSHTFLSISNSPTHIHFKNKKKP
jgi:hypothetical protein